MNYGLNIFNDNKYSQRLGMNEKKKSSIKINDMNYSQKMNQDKTHASNFNESMNLNNYLDDKHEKSNINTHFE